MGPNPRELELKICYIDGFCGPGMYEHGGETHDGSPIIALKIGEDYKDKAELVCMFVDINEEYCFDLECRIEELGLDKNKYDVLEGTFEEALTELLDKVPHMIPAFCFRPIRIFWIITRRDTTLPKKTEHRSLH